MMENALGLIAVGLLCVLGIIYMARLTEQKRKIGDKPMLSTQLWGLTDRNGRYFEVELPVGTNVEEWMTKHGYNGAQSDGKEVEQVSLPDQLKV